MRIGVISYATTVRVDISLRDTNNASLLLDLLEEIEYMAGVTNTADALAAMRNMFERYLSLHVIVIFYH